MAASKRKRIRASDLLKKCSRVGEEMYDFSKIVDIKGGSGRDATKKGRPQGVTSCMPSKTEVIPVALTLPDAVTCETETVVDDSLTERLLTSDETYSNLLKESDGLFMIDKTYQTFMLQDFDKDRVALKTGKFLFTTRRGMAFNEDMHWIYKCTCDVTRSELIECCGDRMHVPYSDFMRRMPGCIHISTLTTILDHFDAVNQIFPTLSRDDNEIDANECDTSADKIIEVRKGLFCVITEHCHGVVDVSKETKCLTCGATLKVKCIHLEKFSSVHEELCQTSGSTRPLSYEPKCLSKRKIPFHSSTLMQAEYKKPFTERFAYDGEYVILVSDNQLCDVCSGRLQETSSYIQANIFGVHQIIIAKIFSKTCMECKKTFHFDGLEQCLLNMGRYIMCHEVLRRFMYYFLTGKSTIFTEYTVLCKMYTDAGHDIQDKLSYGDFKSAWYSFLDLLEVDYSSAFVCLHCGSDPDTVIMDATSVSFRKELVSWQNILSLSNTIAKPYDTRDADRAKERTLFSKTVRSFLLDYTSSGISLEQKGKLLETVQQDNQSYELLSFLKVILEDSIIKGDRIVAKGYWRDLMKALASSYPLCSFLLPSEDLFDFLNCSFEKHASIFEDDTTLSRIQKEVPVFFNLLSNLKEKFPFDTLKDCLPYLKYKVFDPFVNKTCPSELPNEEDIDNLAFFPQLPQIRKRGTFVADKKGSRLKDFCSKFAKGHPHLLPGVFTLFCPHGICYGFQVMKVHESPDVPFTLLRTRFRKAPKLVVYDNACSLHVYSLNRDPVFFKDTSFRVDSLHFRNHTACGPSYELKAYPQYCKLNSQVVEQSNSRLQRLKGSLSYMTQNNFMKHCKFYLWGQNQEILSKNTCSIRP